MKNIYLAAGAFLASLLVASCSVEEPEIVLNSAGNGGSFTIVAETESGAQTKAGISGNDTDGYNVVWEKGDDIYAYAPMAGADYITGSIGVNSGFGTTKAGIQANKPIAPGAIIWSPASLGEMYSSYDSEYLTWPAVQSYSKDAKISGIPMYCTKVETTADSQKLQFKNLGGLLRFTLKGSEGTKLTGIELTSTSPLAGEFSINGTDYPTAVLKEYGSYTEPSNTIRLNVPSVSLSRDGESFYLALMPGNYDGVQVKFSFADRAPVVKSLSRTLVIDRAKITPATITIPDYKAGCLTRIDREIDLKPEEIISKVMEMVGSDNAMLKGALGMMIYAPVHVARIFYYTEDPSGALVEASGVIAYQYGAGISYDRIVSIQHGTCDINKAPSYEYDIATELLPVSIDNTSGSKPKYFVAVMADYLGYGRSETTDLQHPYMHTALTGSACADMITAAEEFIERKSLNMKSNNLDLIGYSQGGAATLQTLAELERRGFKSDRIKQVWAGAGPYDLPGFIDFFKSGENAYGKSGYVPFTLRGICYGEGLDIANRSLYNSSLLSSVDVDALFSHSQLSTWHSVLGNDMQAILHPDFFADGYNGNADIIRVVNALNANSVVNLPQPANVAKIRLYHSETDDTVPYASSEALCQAWPSLGGITNLTTQNSHLKGGIEFMLLYCGLDKYVPMILN